MVFKEASQTCKVKNKRSPWSFSPSESFSQSDTILSFSTGTFTSISGEIISLSPGGATGQKKLFSWDSSSLPDKEKVAANYFGKDRA